MINLVADLNTRLQNSRFGEYCQREKIRDVSVIEVYQFPQSEKDMTKMMLSGVSNINNLRFTVEAHISDDLLYDDDLNLAETLAVIVGSFVKDGLSELAA